MAPALALLLCGEVGAGAAWGDDPYEPNDAWTSATPLSNGETIEAWIAPDGDHDWYSPVITQAGYLEIRLESLPADYDLYLARLNPQTQRLDGIPYQNQGGTASERFTGTIQSTGTYYVRVHAEAGVFDAEDSYLLTVTWPEPQPPPQNVLSIGTAQAVPGTEVSVAIGLANDQSVKALQADVGFDPDVIAFVRGQALGRGAAMVFAAAPRGEGLVRVLFYSDDETYLPPGDGAVACLTFSVAGEAGSESAIASAETHLSDLDAQPLSFDSVDGAVTVLDGQQAPELYVFALKNPARPRALRILAAADQALAAPPEVWVASQPVAMSLIDPAENTYLGAILADSEADSLIVSASATNGTTPASAQTTVIFQPRGSE